MTPCHHAIAVAGCGPAALALALLFSAVPGPTRCAEPGVEAYRREIDAWAARREQALTAETGWLTLVGLHPLAAGQQRLGSAADNDIVLPAGAPARMGHVTVAGDSVTVEFLPGVTAQQNGGAVTGPTPMIPDSRTHPTVFDLGRFQFFLIERSGRLYLRVKDRESRVRREFSGIERFPVEPRWRIEARWEAYDPPKEITVPNVLGDASEATCPGAAVFTVDGKTCRLEPTGDPEAGLFFVFGDATNAHETYGGGRFLSTDPPDSTGTIVLDFNRAYNPPCVFTPFATCPLPRGENVRPVRIEAGEKMYGEGH